MLTWTRLILNEAANFLIPISVTFRQAWISKLDNLRQPRAIVLRLASERSAELLMHRDVKPPQTATPSKCSPAALQTEWNIPSFKDLILGHLQHSSSNAGPESLTFWERSRARSSSSGSAENNFSKPLQVILASSGAKPSESRLIAGAVAGEKAAGSARWRSLRRGQLVARERRVSSPTKPMYLGLNTQGARNSRRLGQDEEIESSSAARYPSEKAAERRLRWINEAAATG